MGLCVDLIEYIYILLLIFIIYKHHKLLIQVIILFEIL